MHLSEQDPTERTSLRDKYILLGDKMKKQAIFIDGQYYLLPDYFKNFEEFYNCLSQKNKLKLNLKKLNEIKCMAPYFDESAISQENLVLRRGTPIFPVIVEILSKKEYHDRLAKIVKDFCPGCICFTDDGDYENLNGFHEEISLDSVCLKRKEKSSESYYKLYLWLEDFCHDFVLVKNDIEKFIDFGKFDLAKEKLMNLFNKIMPSLNDIVIEKKKKSYICYFPTFNQDENKLIFYFLCRYLNSKQLENWKFVNYLPAKVLKNNKNPFFTKIFELNVPVAENFSQDVINFYIKDYDGSDLSFKKNYIMLCNEFGEDKLLNASEDGLIWFTDQAQGNEISYNLLKKKILKANCKNSFFDDKTPIPVVRTVASYDKNGVPNKLVSFCSELFFNTFNSVGEVFDPEKEDNIWKNIFGSLGFSIAKLSIKVSDAMFSKFITSYLLRSLAKIYNSDFTFIYAKESKTDEFNIYFVVADEEKFLYELKRHSPVFIAFPATVEISNYQSLKKFNVDFMFKQTKKKTFVRK